MTLYEKLTKLQNELSVPKGQRNTFGNYNYRSCEDIVEAVKPLLVENKLGLYLMDEIVQIGDRYYIKAQATLIDLEADKTAMTSIAYAREEETKKGMDGSQVTGASSSYARKYALNGLFLLDDARDSDATNTHGKDTPPASSSTQNNSGTAKTTSKGGSTGEASGATLKFGPHAGKTLGWLLENDRKALEKIAEGTGKFADLAQELLK